VNTVRQREEGEESDKKCMKKGGYKAHTKGEEIKEGEGREGRGSMIEDR
jgi:hypothetical protein